MADVYLTSTSLQASFLNMGNFDKKISHAGWVFGTECPGLHAFNHSVKLILQDMLNL